MRSTPDWFDAAKFGIFVHWVPASVPAFAVMREPDIGHENPDWERLFREMPYAEFYQNSMNIPGTATEVYHRERYGDLPYEAFVETFRQGLDGWSPEPWAELFAASGARYVVLVAKHLDGFALWPTATPHPNRASWHSDRDVVGELAAAVRARGMRFGLYYSAGVDWSFGGLPITDLKSLIAATPQSQEYGAYADAQWCELIDRYKPSIVWNDMGYPSSGNPQEVIAHYLEAVPDGVVNDRFDPAGQASGSVLRDFITPEYSLNPPLPGVKWESCRGIGTSFGYNREETGETYAAASSLVQILADVVGRGGNLLLNVGPTATGEIPWPQAERLLAIGWWLRQNGDAVFDTTPWEPAELASTDGIPVRLTQDDAAVHALLLGSPAQVAIELPLRLSDSCTVSLGGHAVPLVWAHSEAGINVQLPSTPDERPVTRLTIVPRDGVSAVAHPGPAGP